jgi:PAS domain-containing protein
MPDNARRVDATPNRVDERPGEVAFHAQARAAAAGEGVYREGGARPMTANDSQDSFRGPDAAPGHVERRRSRGGGSPRSILAELPAVVALGRLPVPILAVALDGAVVFANDAFYDMVGHSPEVALSVGDLLPVAEGNESPVAIINAHANRVVELRNANGFVVHARMSSSALLRGDDPVALVAFHDLTEMLWERGRPV